MTISHRQQAVMPMAEVAAAAAETLYWTQELPGKWKIESASFVPWTARTADVTNYTTYSIDNGATEVYSNNTTTVSLVAGTRVAQVLAATGVGTALEMDQFDVLSFKKVEGGSGLALDGTWNVSLVQIRE